MERLGLWGDGTAFKSFDSFLTSITKRGLGKVLAVHILQSASFGLSHRFHFFTLFFCFVFVDVAVHCRCC